MEPTPTGESATESTPADVPGRVDVDGHADAPPAPPAPRAAYSLPRRNRPATGAPPGRETESRKPAGRDPEGHAYRAPDEETLNRLLAGLRDI